MNDEVSHLTASAAALLAETEERRIRAIRSRRRVLYPRAKQALDRLSGLLDHPRGTRMCLGIACRRPPRCARPISI